MPNNPYIEGLDVRTGAPKEFFDEQQRLSGYRAKSAVQAMRKHAQSKAFAKTPMDWLTIEEEFKRSISNQILDENPSADPDTLKKLRDARMKEKWPAFLVNQQAQMARKQKVSQLMGEEIKGVVLPEVFATMQAGKKLPKDTYFEQGMLFKDYDIDTARSIIAQAERGGPLLPEHQKAIDELESTFEVDQRGALQGTMGEKAADWRLLPLAFDIAGAPGRFASGMVEDRYEGIIGKLGDRPPVGDVEMSNLGEKYERLSNTLIPHKEVRYSRDSIAPKRAFGYPVGDFGKAFATSAVDPSRLYGEVGSGFEAVWEGEGRSTPVPARIAEKNPRSMVDHLVTVSKFYRDEAVRVLLDKEPDKFHTSEDIEEMHGLLMAQDVAFPLMQNPQVSQMVLNMAGDMAFGKLFYRPFVAAGKLGYTKAMGSQLAKKAEQVVAYSPHFNELGRQVGGEAGEKMAIRGRGIMDRASVGAEQFGRKAQELINRMEGIAKTPRERAALNRYLTAKDPEIADIIAMESGLGDHVDEIVRMREELYDLHKTEGTLKRYLEKPSKKKKRDAHTISQDAPEEAGYVPRAIPKDKFDEATRTWKESSEFEKSMRQPYSTAKPGAVATPRRPNVQKEFPEDPAAMWAARKHVDVSKVHAARAVKGTHEMLEEAKMIRSFEVTGKGPTSIEGAKQKIQTLNKGIEKLSKRIEKNTGSPLNAKELKKYVKDKNKLANAQELLGKTKVTLGEFEDAINGLEAMYPGVKFTEVSPIKGRGADIARMINIYTGKGGGKAKSFILPESSVAYYRGVMPWVEGHKKPLEALTRLASGKIRAYNNLWKKGVTSLSMNGQYTYLNAMGTIPILGMALGKRALNPKAAAAAGHISMKSFKGSLAGDLVEKSKFGQTFLGLADDAKYALPSGEKVTYKWLQETMAEYGVTGQFLAKMGIDAKVVGTKGWLQKLDEFTNTLGEKSGIFAMNGVFDEFTHAMTFVTALKGTSKQQITEAVEFAARMSGAYRRMGPMSQVLREVVPFLGWQQFIVPRVVDTIFNDPQRIAFFQRVYQEIENDMIKRGKSVQTPQQLTAGYQQLAMTPPKYRAPEGSGYTAFYQPETPLTMGLTSFTDKQSFMRSLHPAIFAATMNFLTDGYDIRNDRKTNPVWNFEGLHKAATADADLTDKLPAMWFEGDKAMKNAFGTSMETVPFYEALDNLNQIAKYAYAKNNEHMIGLVEMMKLQLKVGKLTIGLAGEGTPGTLLLNPEAAASSLGYQKMQDASQIKRQGMK